MEYKWPTTVLAGIDYSTLGMCVFTVHCCCYAGKDQIVGDGLELQSENKFMRILDRTIPQELLLLCLVFLIRLINSRWCGVQCYVQEEFI